MTIHSNLGSTRFSSLAPTPPAAAKPATSANENASAQPRESAAEALPSLPAGLVGHNVNTTA